MSFLSAEEATRVQELEEDVARLKEELEEECRRSAVTWAISIVLLSIWIIGGFVMMATAGR